MVANGSEPREILLDPMIAGSNGANDFAFDLGIGLRGGPSLEGLEMIVEKTDEAEKPAQNSAALERATREAATFRCSGIKTRSARW